MVCSYRTAQHCSRLYPWITHTVTYQKMPSADLYFGVMAVAYVKGQKEEK